MPEKDQGVYVVALTSNTESFDGTLGHAPICISAVERWLDVRPELELDGHRPAVPELADRLASFWLPDEVVVYVGLSKRPLRTRVREYVRTPLGATGPHSGGHFLKMLEPIDLYVHYAPTSDFESAEHEMLRSFVGGVSSSTLDVLRDPGHPFPFANLEWPRGTRKAHGIGKSRGAMPLG